MSSTTATTHDKPLPDWERLSFALTETDWLYRTFGESKSTPVWDDGAWTPFADIKISPAAAFVSYGLGIFEGLKAQKALDGRVLLFRPEKNAERFQHSARRLLMEPFPVERFVETTVELVRRNARFIPPCEKGSFYIRPLEHAIEPKLGLGPCSRFAVTMFGSPVGSYFSGGKPAGVRLRVLEQGRVAPGGTGNAKAMGNYAGGIAIASRWRQEGYDDVLYLDARHLQYVTETSGSNVFVRLRDGTIVTPPLDDQILAGITRQSAIDVARETLGLTIDERALPIDEVIADGVEIFCTGTAWTVQSVREIVYKDRTHSFPAEDVRRSLLDVLRGIQTGAREDPFGWVHEVEID